MADTPEANQPFSAEEILRPLRENRGFIAIFVLSAVLTALALTYAYSERYRSEVTIFFKPSEVTHLSSHSIQALGSPFPYTLFKVVAQTVIGLVDSDGLLRRVVLELRLDAKEPKDFSGPWYIRLYKELKYWLAELAGDAWQLVKWGRFIEEDPVEQAIAQVRKSIKVRNDDSYVFTLQVTAKSPERAAATADALGAALVEVLAQDNRRASSKRGEELATLRNAKLREIEGIESRMQNLLANLGVASIQQEIEAVTGRASTLLQQRSDTIADLQQSEGKEAELGRRLALSGIQPVAQQDGAGLRRSNRITPDDYAKLTSDKLAAGVATAALRARLGSMDRLYGGIVPRLQQLNAAQAEHDLMSTQLQAAKRDYAALNDSYQETVIKNASGQSELHIQSKATLPNEPVSPVKIYHVGMAGFLSALIAIGLAFVFDYFGIRFFPPPAGGRHRQPEPPSAVPEAQAAPVTAG